MVDFLQSFWWFLVLIGVMILLHELGHYLVARLFDVKVEAFSFGFGPRLFGIKRGETDFRFCAFLLGGYVKMAGEQPGDEEGAQDPRAFPAKPRWQRLLIIFAGPAVNIVLAIALLAGLFMFEFPKVPNPQSPRVGYVSPDGVAAKAGIMIGDRIIQVEDVINPTWWNDIDIKEKVTNAGKPMNVWVDRNGERLSFVLTPVVDEKTRVGSVGWLPEGEVEIGGFCCNVDAAEKAGLKRGDIVASLNGVPIRSSQQFTELIAAANGAPIKVVYRREGTEHETTVTAAWSNYDGRARWMIGAELSMPFEITQLPLGEAIRESMKQNRQNALVLYQFLQGIVERRMSPKAIDGPIGIARLSGQAARRGANAFIELMAMVSLNLAVVNLLPIPLLDGGSILMLLVEMLLRRDLDLRVKEAVVKFGLVFLMVVIVFVIYNDISKIIIPPG